MQEIATSKAIAVIEAMPKLTCSKQKKAGIRRVVMVMKITAILLFVACLQVSAKGISQTVTLSEKNAPLIKVIKSIEKQTDFVFFYKMDWLDKAEKVTIEIKDRPLQEALDICFRNQPLGYSILDKIITIGPKKEPTGEKKMPPIDVSGRISDEDGSPLQGANIKIKGTNIGTTTNAAGVFTLKDVDENAQLEISYIGFQTIIVAVKKTIIISLIRSETKLQEVIINKGYYSELKKFSTANVGKVTAQEIEKQPIDNPLLALQGRVAGVVITQANGVPGGGVQVRIQGQNSLGNGNAPLYIVDGTPFPTDVPTAGNSFGPLGTSGESLVRGGALMGTGNALSFLNPQEIESIEVLKDADATSIYGSRAANGAILITTKKGKPGKSKLDITYQEGWGKVARTMDMMNTRQYLDMRYEALRNDGLIASSDPAATAPFIYAPDLTIWDTTRYTDWKKVLIGRTARYTNINANVSGGNNIIQYRIGTTYSRETSVFPGSYYDQKNSVNFNLNNSSSSQKFKFQLSANYSIDNNKLPNTDITQYALLLAPNAPTLYNDDGTLNWAPNSKGTSTWLNPLAATLYKTYDTKANILVSNANLSYKIFPGLEVSANFGYNNIQIKDIQLNKVLSNKPESSPSRTANYGNRNVITWIVEPQISFKQTVLGNKLDLLIGSTFQETTTDAGYFTGATFNNDEVLRNPTAAGVVVARGYLNTLYRLNAIFGRLNYNILDKYILNLTARRDGTSRFGDYSKFHNFGGLGAAWIFTKEDLFKNIRFFSFGKLKASYGTTGSDQIGDYRYLSLYSIVSSGINYQNATGLTPGDIPNPYLEWEKTNKLNIGIELGFFNDRIFATVNYARNQSSNQLLDYILPNMTGRGSVLKNFPATIQNTSWEFGLNAEIIKNRQFSWTANFNLTAPRNKLVEFQNLETSSYATAYIVGQPINIQRIYHFLGVDPATGLYVVADKSGNPTSSPAYEDATIFVSSFANYYAGISNSIGYKGFQLDFLFQIVKQKGSNGTFTNATYSSPGKFYTVDGTGNQPVNVLNLNHWQKPGDVALVQRFSASRSDVDSRIGLPLSSDANFTSIAFARLKNVSLSWTLPKKLINKIRIQNAKLFTHAQNILTITNYKGMDPENQSLTALPPLKMVTIGVQISL